MSQVSTVDTKFYTYKIPNIREPANFRSFENHSPDHEWRPILSRRIYIRLFDHAEGMPRKKEKL